MTTAETRPVGSAKPYIYFHSDADPRVIADGCDCGDREWVVETPYGLANGDKSVFPGASADTLEHALVYARLVIFYHELGWFILDGVENPMRPWEGRRSECWCGWIKQMDGWHGGDILAHVLEAHPQHPVVLG